MKSSGLTFIKLIIGVLTVFAVVVVVYQLYKYNFDSIKTESAVMGEMEETVDAAGIFFRDEKVIDGSAYEYLDVIRSEGERVASGGVVARVYPDETSAKVRKEIREVEEKIATYEEVLANSSSYSSATDSIEQDIYEDLTQISELSRQGSAGEAFEGAENVVLDIMKKKIASGDLVSYDKTLESLRQQLSELKASGSSSVTSVTTDQAGYFSYSTDGLEDQLTTEYLETLSVDTFDDALELCNTAAATGSELGKMVYQSTWSVAIKVQNKAVSSLSVNDVVYIKIPSFGTDRIKCVIADIRKDGEESVMVLNSSIISSNILTLRQENISLIIETYSGILVRQSALRKVEGKEGVFVKVGLLLRYKEVNVLYNDGTNAIIEYVATDESGLRIYDQVVYKGSDLYDGKAVT